MYEESTLITVHCPLDCNKAVCLLICPLKTPHRYLQTWLLLLCPTSQDLSRPIIKCFLKGHAMWTKSFCCNCLLALQCASMRLEPTADPCLLQLQKHCEWKRNRRLLSDASVTGAVNNNTSYWGVLRSDRWEIVKSKSLFYHDSLHKVLPWTLHSSKWISQQPTIKVEQWKQEGWETSSYS